MVAQFCNGMPMLLARTSVTLDQGKRVELYKVFSTRYWTSFHPYVHLATRHDEEDASPSLVFVHCKHYI